MLTRAEINKKCYDKRYSSHRQEYILNAKNYYYNIKKQNLPERICLNCGNLYKGLGKKFCGLKCSGENFKGFKHTEEAKKKVAESLQNKTGKFSRNWQGGLKAYNVTVRSRLDYKNFRIAVLKRDHYTCQKCGFMRGAKYDGYKPLHVHHIFEVYQLTKTPFEHHINNPDNGITLCGLCHKAIPVRRKK